MMNIKDLRESLEKNSDKLSIFTSTEILAQCNYNVKELINLIDSFLNDEEKIKLFDYPLYRKPNISTKIITLISDENVMLKLIDNDSVMDSIGYQIIDIILEKLSDSGKHQVLYNQKFTEKYPFRSYSIIFSLSEHNKIKILTDRDLVTNRLHIEDKQIAKLIKGLTSEDLKRKILGIYKLENHIKLDIINTFSEEGKLRIVLEENELLKYDKLRILSSLSTNMLSQFFNNKDFYIENGIHPYEITIALSNEQQKSFVEQLETMGLTIIEKREILATLSTEVKQYIDAENFSKEYKSAIDTQTFNDNIILKILNTDNIANYILLYKIVDLMKNLSNKAKKQILCNHEFMERLDLEADELKDIISSLNFKEQGEILINNDIVIDNLDLLEDYSGLGSSLKINPEQFTEEDRTKFMQLCDIYPELKVVNRYYCMSTTSEYKEAEEWISSILENIKSEYSDAQKIAIIDNAIGKKISYSPDFDTEVLDEESCRALWRIISSGYGVCNGISCIEQYMLSRVGIESEVIDSHNHSFLKIKNIEITLANGQIVKGNTILDPTWNLAAHRFGGKPDNFCISYEEARKHDINVGVDYYCHENDEKLNDATLNLDEESLRMLFTSVGLADEKGIFPIAYMIEKSKLLHKHYEEQPNVDIEKQFLLLSKICPEFATCQNSTMTILKDVILNSESLEFNKCVASRVYDRADTEKRPILFVYIDSNKLGKKFYYACKNEGMFVELSPEQFTKQFECYEYDLIRNKGFKPWELKENEDIDLSRSSGTIIAKEGEEK